MIYSLWLLYERTRLLHSKVRTWEALPVIYNTVWVADAQSRA